MMGPEAMRTANRRQVQRVFEFQATCHHCMTIHILSDLKRAGVETEPDTNGYEEDTVNFRCPDCKKKVQGAIVCRASSW